jgi:hypothetical protein
MFIPHVYTPELPSHHRGATKPTGQQADDQQDNKQEEEELSDASGTGGDSPKSENARDDCQYKKCESPGKHRIAPFESEMFESRSVVESIRGNRHAIAVPRQRNRMAALFLRVFGRWAITQRLKGNQNPQSLHRRWGCRLRPESLLSVRPIRRSLPTDSRLMHNWASFRLAIRPLTLGSLSRATKNAS